MRRLFKNLTGDKIVIFFLSAAAITLVLTFLFIFIVYRSLPQYIPLFNQLPWGEPRIGKTIYIFIPPLAVFGFLIMDTVFSSLVYKRIPLLSRILAVTAFLCVFLISIFTVRTAGIVL